MVSLTSPGQPLIVETTGPVITSAACQPGSGHIIVKLHDINLVSDLSMADATFYIVTIPGRKSAIAIKSIAVQGAGETATVTLSLAFRKRMVRPTKIKLEILAGGVVNLAGVPLDGTFSRKLPSGDGQPGGNFVAVLPLELMKPKRSRIN